jgi:hypothetical protein
MGTSIGSKCLKVPVFQDIATIYQDRIAPQEQTGREKKSAAVERQLAKRAFRMDEELQERIYGQASEEEITKDRDRGLSLLFWKRLTDGRLVGCVISDSELRGRLITLIPEVYTAVRILILVNEQGNRLAAPEEGETRDYRRPFVARELSAVLTLWAAAYLTDPEVLSSRTSRTGSFLWALISILFVSILDEVWGIRYQGTTRTLDQHIANLRTKIEDDPACPRTIVTVHRVRYRFYPAGGGDEE